MAASEILRTCLLILHALAGAAWFGSIFYGVFVLYPRVSRQRPDARFEVKAGVAVRMHPGLAEIIAEPYGMPSGARVNPDVLLHRSAIIQRMRGVFVTLAFLVCTAVSAQAFPTRDRHSHRLVARRVSWPRRRQERRCPGHRRRGRRIRAWVIG